jgi:hypothetical protein
VKTILEAICELNHHWLRPAADKPPRSARQPGGRRG